MSKKLLAVFMLFILIIIAGCTSSESTGKKRKEQ